MPRLTGRQCDGAGGVSCVGTLATAARPNKCQIWNSNSQLGVSLPDPYRRFNRNLKKRLGGLQTSPLLDLRFKIPRRDWGRDYTADNQHVVQRSALKLYCIVAYYRLIQLHLVIPSILCCPNQSINIHTCDCFRQPHLSSLDLSRS